MSKSKMLGEKGHYLMGLNFLKLKDADEARKSFTFVLENYPDSSLKSELLLGTADSYYLGEDFRMAEEYYKRLLMTSKGIDYASIAYFKLGKAQQKQGKFKEARSNFSKVVRDYPLSLEVNEAKECLKASAQFFSVQVGVFSKRENAKRLADTLTSKGYDPYIEKIYNNDKLAYRVKAGTFSSRGRAQTLADKLEREGFSVRIYP
ncbi:MAG: SPOR domain-containing protein [Candidatus Omnitrophica bacterium]|nr:SPOR domain-containing protein [Candidatus Omnitrophota bacterium]